MNRMLNPFAIPLEPNQTPGMDLVGGKGYNLLQLLGAGMPVPGGFVITTAASRAWVAAGRTWPPQLSSEIQKSYEQLGAECLVAVRSSGTAEDLEGASFAGGHETILNVSDWNDLQPAIETCWASLDGERVRDYRSKMGVGEDGLAIAVVIQYMVRARVSGVVFTAEPVSGDAETIALDACAGLGEGLVSGQVTPEHFELRRKDLSVVKVQNKAGHLSKKEVREIARSALGIERHFGCPQDIEWSIDQAGCLRILQARPITTGSAVRWENSTEGAIWVRRGAGGLAEYLPTAVTPLYATAQLPRIMELHEVLCEEMGVATPRPSMALINGHFYSRQDYKLGWSALRLPLSYWRAGRGAARTWRKAVPFQTAALETLKEFDCATATDTALVMYINQVLDFNAGAWDHAARAARAWEVGEPFFKRIFESFVKEHTGGDAVTFLRGFESQTLASEQALIDLVEAAKLSPDVSKIVRLFSGQEALANLQACKEGREWLRGLSDYCSRYGHVTSNQDYYCASPADDAGKVLETVRTRMDLKTSNPMQRQLEVTAQRKRAEAETLQKLASSPLRRRVFEWALDWAQEGASIREDVFFFAFVGWPLARRAILEMGKRLTERGIIDVAEDVCFLTWVEFIESGSRRASTGYQRIVAERRADFAAQANLAPPPMVPVGGPPTTAASRIKAVVKKAITGSSRRASKDELYGSAVSPGRVTGPARLLASAADVGRLQAGDIVVTRAATPDWTPTFSIAAGLVTDTGGPLSHCSIVAREFGIPAVMGVPTATQRILEGQIITIDGAQGSVFLHALPEAV